MDIMDFGRNSFVTWTTGLIERIQEAEKENQQYRGLTKEGKWVYGWYAKVIGYHYIIPDDADIAGISPPNLYGIINSIEVIPETVGQFTGLKDKNGKEKVYVDDEIYFSMSQTQHYKGYVKWNEKGLCYIVECYWHKQDEIPHLCDGYEMNYKYKDTCIRRLDSECFDIEIIGNVHQPELTEQDNG